MTIPVSGQGDLTPEEIRELSAPSDRPPHLEPARPYAIDDVRHRAFWAEMNAFLRRHKLPSYAELWDENGRLKAALEAHNRALTPGEAAKLLGVTRHTIGNMVGDGRLKPMPQPRSLPRRFDPEANPILKEKLQGDDRVPTNDG